MGRTSRFRCNHYHFHDTSPESRIRNKVYVDDSSYLRSDAGNLAAYLAGLRASEPDTYARIVRTIQQVLPFFEDFVVAPLTEERYLLLNWKERGKDYLFGPHQLSDGAVRTMALVTAILHPQSRRPLLSVIDEPELGLHPYAISVVAGLMRSASHQTQMILSTQSVSFLEQFSPDDVIVVDRGDGGSAFRRLSAESLREWLDEYTLGELWEKNVLGGRPSR